VNLIPRLYDATSGEVRVFGHDVREYPFIQLRELVSTVPQQASLVSGTIRSNLCWRDSNATDEELWRALELAQAADFVRGKDQGLDAVVEAGGKNFSGGQRQRLTIARALVGHPRIVVLDDSASALDFRTDASLRQSLRSLRSELTCVIVSQRVSAVMSCDQILVLDHGRMAGLGSHTELMRSCPIYREICLSQLRPEEVGA
jgi:ATP-binding cassette subfamily B protein